MVNLMDALRRSIEEERRPPAASLGKTAAATGKPATKKPAVKAVAAEPGAKKKKSA